MLLKSSKTFGFPNLFPKEFLGLPPYREIEFSIDLVPSLQLTSIPLHRMT